MDVAKISDADQQAVRRAIEYWVEHWDCECPTLFGIELDELQQVLRRWPRIDDDDEAILESVAVAALRELLYGASSPPKAAVHQTIGISYDQAETLIVALRND